MSAQATLVVAERGLRERLLAAALGYAARGMAVHPLHVGAKRPPLWHDWETRATTDPDVIRQVWRRAPFNIGVATGPSRLVVVDLDVPKPGEGPPDRWADAGVADGIGVLAALAQDAGEPWPATMTTKTPSGGRHLLYRAPADGIELRNSARSVGWCIDVRAHGGYVVGIGSQIRGQDYVLHPLAPPTPCDLPRWLLTLIERAAKEPTTGANGKDGRQTAARLRETLDSVDRSARWATAALLGEADDIAAMAPETGRNAALNGAAFKLGRLVGGGLLVEDDVRQALGEAATAAGLPAAEVQRTIQSGITAGIRRPRRSVRA